MPLNVLAIAGDESKVLELDSVSLMFFDTVMATLNSHFPGHRTPFDFFEYWDEDGENCSVRSDEELETFLAEMTRSGQIPLKIRPRSSNSLMQQQMSFDEADELILPTTCPSSTLPPKEEESSKNGSLGFGISKSIGPEDLQLIERLSDGQFGTVYKALDVRSDRLVAVKCIAVDNTSGTRQGLLNEIGILRKCSHPNIVTFHAALFVQNQLLICMELMDALSLDLYGQLPPPVLGAVTLQVVEGLVHLWRLCIMHRDIKASNFLVNFAGQVKLVLGDFGVSKQMAHSIAWSYVGTKVYMAPERIGGDVYNVASDVWSLGVSLAEMALGRFPSPMMGECLCPDSISSLLNDQELASVGNGFGELLSGCIALDPAKRWSPESIRSSAFLQAHRPVNQQIVAKFIGEKAKKLKATMEEG